MKPGTRLVLTIGIIIAAIAMIRLSLPLLAAPVESAQLRPPPVNKSCDPKRFPTNRPAAAQCCQDGNRTWHTLKESNTMVFRVYGAPCREDDGVGTNCGVGTNPFKPCSYGACGAKNVWAIHADSVNIFHPTSNPNVCGLSISHVLDVPICNEPGGCMRVGSSSHLPEPFSNQTVYAIGTRLDEVGTNTCTYTKCLRGGKPAE